MIIRFVMDSKLFLFLVNAYTKVVDYLANMNTEPKYIAWRTFFNFAIPDLSIVLFVMISNFLA